MGYASLARSTSFPLSQRTTTGRCRRAKENEIIAYENLKTQKIRFWIMD